MDTIVCQLRHTETHAQASGNYVQTRTFVSLSARVSLERPPKGSVKHTLQCEQCDSICTVRIISPRSQKVFAGFFSIGGLALLCLSISEAVTTPNAVGENIAVAAVGLLLVAVGACFMLPRFACVVARQDPPRVGVEHDVVRVM